MCTDCDFVVITSNADIRVTICDEEQTFRVFKDSKVHNYKCKSGDVVENLNELILNLRN